MANNGSLVKNEATAEGLLLRSLRSRAAHFQARGVAVEMSCGGVYLVEAAEMFERLLSALVDAVIGSMGAGTKVSFRLFHDENAWFVKACYASAGTAGPQWLEDRLTQLKLAADYLGGYLAHTEGAAGTRAITIKLPPERLAPRQAPRRVLPWLMGVLTTSAGLSLLIALAIERLG